MCGKSTGPPWSHYWGCFQIQLFISGIVINRQILGCHVFYTNVIIVFTTSKWPKIMNYFVLLRPWVSRLLINQMQK